MRPEETLDLIAFAEEIVEALAEHKADDGKIDTAEIVSTVISTAPAAIRAIAGAGDISEEMKNLDEEDKELLAQKSIAVIHKLVGMFIDLDGKK